MCQRIRQPLRAETRSIFLRSLFMVAMVLAPRSLAAGHAMPAPVVCGV
jgi:hypothetical protein